MMTKSLKRGNVRNSETFDPANTIMRPNLRVWVGLKDAKVYETGLKRNDDTSGGVCDCYPLVPFSWYHIAQTY